MRKGILILLSVCCIFYLECCACSKNITNPNNELKIVVNLTEINCWMNLMPGTDKPTFHTAGKMKIKNLEDTSITEIKIKSLKINQDENSLYELKPELYQTTITHGNRIQPQEEKEYQFKLEKRTVIKKLLNTNKPIEVEFLFNSGEKTFKLSKDNINIERVY